MGIENIDILKPAHQGHGWPTDDTCLFGSWNQATQFAQYRVCVHPKCKNVETRDIPKA